MGIESQTEAELRRLIEGLDRDRKIHCRLGRSADTAIATSVWTGIPWDTELFDPSGLHAPGAESWVIQTPGIYRMIAEVWFQTHATGIYRLVKFDLNAGAGGTLGESGVTWANPGTDAVIVQAHAVANLARGDVVTPQAFQNSGGNLNVLLLSWAAITYQGPAS